MTRRRVERVATALMAVGAIAVMVVAAGHKRPAPQSVKDSPRTTPSAASRSLPRPPWLAAPITASPSRSALATVPSSAEIQMDANTTKETADQPTAQPEDRGRPTAAQWAKLRWCESRGEYAINTGNGYYGAYQFDLPTWHGIGMTGLPSAASPDVQDAAALKLWLLRGWQPWPACSKKLGLR